MFQVCSLILDGNQGKGGHWSRLTHPVVSMEEGQRLDQVAISQKRPERLSLVREERLPIACSYICDRGVARCYWNTRVQIEFKGCSSIGSVVQSN